jgi:hypothetical protein
VFAVVLCLVAADAAGAQRVEDGPRDRVKPPLNLVPPRVAGEAVQGSTLTGYDGVWSGVRSELVRRWQRLESGFWTDIARAVGPSHVLRAEDVGHRLRLMVRGWGSGGIVAAHSAPTALVLARPVRPPVPTPAPAPPPPAPAAPAPAPLIGFPTAAFRATGRSTITLRWGERSVIAGTLRRADGSPLTGASLSVTSRLHVTGAQPLPLGAVATDTAGAFTYTPPAGPSRAITFGFGDRYASVTIRVVPRVTVTVSRGGRVAGRVAGAPPGIRKRVELEARRGGSWRTIAATRLDLTGGRFSHRLRRPPRRIRAVVRAAPGWPFLTGVSPPATVRR